MLIDAKRIPVGKVFDTDICILGAGVAGITLAREFIHKKQEVILLESGGFQADEQTQNLYEGKIEGPYKPPLAECRSRFFGGTSNRWAGWCLPLEDFDFEKRDWIPYSGWPFSKKELLPFYEKAQKICELGPFRYEANEWVVPGDPEPFPFSNEFIKTKVYQYSPPTRFGEKYRKEILDASNIKTFLHANALELETDSSKQKITSVTVSSFKKNRFFIRAKKFVVAMGGIENARFLLLSNKQIKKGIGNQNDLVGRFFIEHPHFLSGMILPRSSNGVFDFYESIKQQSNTKVSGVLTLAEAFMKKEKIAGWSATTQQSLLHEPYSRGLKSTWRIREAIQEREWPDDFDRHMSEIMRDLDGIAGHYKKKILKEPNKGVDVHIIYTRSEQVPNPESRIKLGSERDAFGQPRTELHWKLSRQDRDSVIKAHQVLSREFGKARLGRLKMWIDPFLNQWTPDLKGGHHHMGTTRMHPHPKQGVVNANGRVHGMANLYIAGSSVFPTGGYANPTLTIVALALRLANHLK